MPTPQRLPIVNSDDAVWGDILRQYLKKEHYDTGADNAANGGHQTVTIQPGTTGAGTAPLKFSSGPLMTTPEAGAVEFLTDKLYFTQTTGTARKAIATYFDDGSGATGDIYFRNSSALFTRLAIGSTNDLLTVASGIPAWTSSIVGKTLDNTNTVTLKDNNFILQDDTDVTKQAKFQLSGITTGTTRTYTLPDANGTFATTGAALLGQYDATGAGNSAGTATTNITWSHTTSGVNRALFVGVAVGTTSTSFTGYTRTVTYNSVSMTSAGVVNSGTGTTNGFVELFYLLNPATGSHTVSVTLNTSTGEQSIEGTSVSYTGVTGVGTAATSNSPSTASSFTTNAASITQNGDFFVTALVSGSPITSINNNQRSIINHDINSRAGNLGMADAFNMSSATFTGTSALDWWGAVSLPVYTDIITTTATQTLTNKTINFSNNTLTGTTAQFNTANSDADFYTTGGTDVALADGGTGTSLTDPNADRIMFWDDSAGATAWLAPGNGLSITGTTIDASSPYYKTVRLNDSGNETYTISAGNVTQIAGTTLDSVSPAIGDRILICSAPATTGVSSFRTNQPGNGIYVVTGNTTNLTLARASDMSGSETPIGTTVYIREGNGNAGWLVSCSSPTTGAFTWGTTPNQWGYNYATYDYIRNGIYTLANKTINLTSNVLSGTTAQFNAALSDNDFATLAGAEILTNKTLTTPVLNGTPTGTGVSTTATASRLALRDSNGNLSAVNFNSGYTTTVTSGGTTTLTAASTYQQWFTGSSGQTVTMPVTSTLNLGQSFFLYSNGNATITINASDASNIFVMAAGSVCTITCVSTGITSSAAWVTNQMNVWADSGKAGVFNNTLTLAGTDFTTMTFPGSSDTVVGLAAAQTLTNKTLTSPTMTNPTLGVASATTINKVTITAPATGSTLTIPNGTTLTGPASSGTAMTLGNTETVTGVKTFGSAGAVGRLKIAGTTSGSTILDATAAASGTLTLPAATDTLVGKATTDTLTNKAIQPRVTAITSSATPAINTDSADLVTITAQAVAITSMTSSLTGTPVNGQKLMIRIKDNGTAQTIAWGASFVSSGVATLLATTVISKTHLIGFIYDSTAAKWVCVAVDTVGY